MSKNKIFLAGKTTGDFQSEVITKYKVAERTLAKHWHVYNPIEKVPPGASFELATRQCIAALMDCTAIYMLKDWKDSDHANIMYNNAVICGIEVMYEAE